MRKAQSGNALLQHLKAPKKRSRPRLLGDLGALLGAETWHTSQSGGWHHLDFQQRALLSPSRGLLETVPLTRLKAFPPVEVKSTYNLAARPRFEALGPSIFIHSK